MTPELRHLLTEIFLAFAQKAFAQLNHGQKLEPHAYVEFVARMLEGVADGTIKRLVLSMPPRHAKTFLASICLPAWILAHNPAAKILIISYSQVLADAIARQILRILAAKWFRELFPKTCIAKKQTNDFATTAGGRVRSESIEGSVTGFGGDFILVDDPLEIKDWDNDKRRKRVNSLFDSEIRTRLDNPKKGAILIIAHRLAEDDLPGHVLAEGGFREIRLPLIAERKHTYRVGDFEWNRAKGELLRPDAYTPREIRRLRGMEEPGFETLYQQNPGKRDRLRIKPKHFGEFVRDELPNDLAVVLSIDPGHKGGQTNSFSVMQAWTVQDNRYYLLDQFREQASYKDFRSEARRFILRFRPSVVLVEATGQGPSLLSDLRPQQGMRFVPITPTEDKKSRLRRHIRLIRSGIISLPKWAAWHEEFLAELTLFPYAAFDDQVDALSQFLDWITKNPVPEMRPPRAVIAGPNSQGHPLSNHAGTTVSIPGAVLALNSRVVPPHVREYFDRLNKKK